MRADRLLSTVLLLQAHGRLSGRELAKRLEVSMRTLHRDMDALSAAGVPVFAMRGARGGWQLDEQWRTQVPGLDEAELRALLMAQPRVIGDARLAAAAESALSKLLASLPNSLREKAASIQQRLFVDTTGWRGTPENLSMLPIVQDAVSRDHKLTILYAKNSRERVERTLDPLGLVAKSGTWYLVANTTAGLRTFRVSRIEKARVLDERSERPTDFDLAKYWRSSAQRFREGWPHFDTVLRLHPDAANQMKRWHMAAEDGRGPDTEGWTTMIVRFDDEEQACFLVLAQGARVDVIEPASLRARVARELSAALDRIRRQASAAAARSGA
jgi:predicted DNA-binding transcriptional regulator YafY